MRNLAVVVRHESLSEVQAQIDRQRVLLAGRALEVARVTQAVDRLRDAAMLLLGALGRLQGPDATKAALQACPQLRAVRARGACAIKALPAYLLSQTMVWLDGVSVARCARVCTSWRAVTSHDAVWRTAVVADLGGRAVPEGMSVRAFYMAARMQALDERLAAVRELVQRQLAAKAPQGKPGARPLATPLQLF